MIGCLRPCQAKSVYYIPAQLASGSVPALEHAGTVLKLGTAIHHDAMLDGIDRVEPTGCFALTELGFGTLDSLRLPALLLNCCASCVGLCMSPETVLSGPCISLAAGSLAVGRDCTGIPQACVVAVILFVNWLALCTIVGHQKQLVTCFLIFLQLQSVAWTPGPVTDCQKGFEHCILSAEAQATPKLFCQGGR